jgi:hypothetical protein
MTPYIRYMLLRVSIEAAFRVAYEDVVLHKRQYTSRKVENAFTRWTACRVDSNDYVNDAPWDEYHTRLIWELHAMMCALVDGPKFWDNKSYTIVSIALS